MRFALVDDLPPVLRSERLLHDALARVIVCCHRPPQLDTVGSDIVDDEVLRWGRSGCSVEIVNSKIETVSKWSKIQPNHMRSLRIPLNVVRGSDLALKSLMPCRFTAAISQQ